MIRCLRRCMPLVLEILLLLTPSCSWVWQKEAKPSPVTLRVVLLPFMTFAPFFIAEELGYFGEQGLQIEFVKMSGSLGGIPALAQGELDVLGGTMSVGILNAIARGARIKIVSNRGYIPPTGCVNVAFMARRRLIESGALESLLKLRGRRVAFDPTLALTGYLVEKLLGSAGLTISDVETVNIPQEVVVDAFKNDRIDVALVVEPWLTRILKAGHAVIWMPAQQVAPDFELGFNIYGPTLLEQNPDAGRRFLIAYLKALRQYNQGKTERNIEILAKHTGLDRELLKQMCWPSFREDGRIKMQTVLDFQSWALSKKLIDRVLREDEFLDTTFIERANEALQAQAR